MKIEYDDKYDLLYFRFDDTQQEVINQRLNDSIVLDIGKNGKIVGIEIMDAKDVINLSNILPVNFLNPRNIELIEV